MFTAGGFLLFFLSVLASGLFLLILCHGIWCISAYPPEVTQWPYGFPVLKGLLHNF